jgi:hypothetical protein
MQKSPSRQWDWLSVSLIFLLIQLASARLVTTNWAPYLYFSETLAAMATIIGVTLGISKFGRRMTGLLSLAYTAVLVPWQMSGSMTDELFADRLTHLDRVLSASLILFLQRKPVTDPLFFVAFVSITFWFISLCAGYWLVRHNNIAVAVLPSSIAILLIQVYDNYRLNASWWLAVYILVVLLLLGREYYLQSRKNWGVRRVFINEESWPNIFGNLFGTVVLIVVIAWLIPTSVSSWRSAADSWNNFTRPLTDRLSNAVISLNGNYKTSPGNYYDTSLALGSDAGRGDSTVFTVQVLTQPAANLRYYWRGRIYDYYSNGQWTETPSHSLGFQPVGGDLKIPNSAGRSEALLKFTNHFPAQSLIYTPSQPVWIDRPGKVTTTFTETNLDDILSWEATSALLAGDQVQVRSEIADPTFQELRTAGTAYPQWVTDRYLEVPDNIKAEIKDLAEKVSISQVDPYDKAVAITDYLRANIQYATSLPEVPSGRDPVLWVLFDYKKGFCNYYASAEVLMLRSLGIPARMAVGFAEGQYQAGTYIVRQRDAHAWPEVYFPGAGWVEFEPTANQDALIRPSASSQANGAPSNAIEPPRKPVGELDNGPASNNGATKNVNSLVLVQTIFGRILIPGSIILLIVLALILLRRYQILERMPFFISDTYEKAGIAPPTWIETWSRWNRAEPIEHLFASINWSLNQFGQPQSMDVTPSDRSRILKKLLPSAAADIDALTSEFEAGLFTQRNADLARARRSSLSIVIHTLRARLQKFLDAMNAGDVYSG